jgi:flagella basal body P-ring formation protein FlgA
MKLLSLTWLIAALLAGQALASGYQDIGAIRQTVRQFVELQQQGRSRPPVIEVSTIDPRLRLAACGKKLVAFLPAGGRSLGNTTIGVRCTGNTPWVVYVPTTVRVFDKVLITTRPLNRGTVLTAADFRAEERDLTTLTTGFVTDPLQAAGKQVRQIIPAGSVLNPTLLVGQKLVKRGDFVAILANTSGLEVRMRGQAMDDGAVGDRIKVRNPLNKKVIDGIVTTNGHVRVEM